MRWRSKTPCCARVAVHSNTIRFDRRRRWARARMAPCPFLFRHSDLGQRRASHRCLISASRAADSAWKACTLPPASGCADLAARFQARWISGADSRRSSGRPSSLPMKLLRRRRLQRDVAPAEPRGGERMQDFADDSEAAPRGLGDAGIGGFGRGVAQDRQRLRGGLPQDHFGAGARHHIREARGFAPVGRGGLPDPLDFELPFPELAIHGRYRGERIQCAR